MENKNEEIKKVAEVKEAPKPSRKNAGMDTKTLIMLGVAVISFVFLFIAWIKIDVYFYSETFNIFHSGMFEVSVLLGFSKIFSIVAIVAFCVYVISQFVDLKTLVPALKDVDFKKLAPIAYFGAYGVALVFALLGIITTSYVGIGWGWFIGLIFAGLGLLFTFKPMMLTNLVKSVKK